MNWMEHNRIGWVHTCRHPKRKSRPIQDPHHMIYTFFFYSLNIINRFKNVRLLNTNHSILSTFCLCSCIHFSVFLIQNCWTVLQLWTKFLIQNVNENRNVQSIFSGLNATWEQYRSKFEERSKFLCRLLIRNHIPIVTD